MPDEQAQPNITTEDALRAAIRAELAAEFDGRFSAAQALFADELDAAPDHLKKLIPESLTPTEQVRWLRKAKASGAFVSPTVPATDSRRPSNSPAPIDSATLSPIARIASGYSNSQK